MSDRNSNANLHLTLEERHIILTGITNGSAKTAIAQTIGKDKSTVGKEIKLHRSLSHKYRRIPCGFYLVSYTWQLLTFVKNLQENKGIISLFHAIIIAKNAKKNQYLSITLSCSADTT